MSQFVPIAKLLWASPGTLVGLSVGMLGLATGGHWRWHGAVLEFWGGGTTWCLDNVPLMPGGALAMTLGHVVLGCSEHALDITHEHELVHVRQYERWGPAFLPAYLACSAWLWLRGRDFYRENPFEREAFEKCKRSGN